MIFLCERSITVAFSKARPFEMKTLEDGKKYLPSQSFIFHILL